MDLRKKSNTRSLSICYLKAMEGQVSLSTLLGTLRVCINSSFFSDILMVVKDPRFKSFERINIIDFSLSLEIRSLDILPSVT